MKNWQCEKTENNYKFIPKGSQGIDEISVYVFDIPDKIRTETHVTTDKLETFKNSRRR